MMTATQLVNYFDTWLQALISASREVITWLITPFSENVLPDWLQRLLPEELLGVTPLSLVIGAGLVVYLSYTLIKWFLPT